MSAPAIEVSGLSKRYVIEHESRHDTLRDTLHHTARKLWRRFRWGTGFAREEFWALRDISFSVQPGEVVGIIGRNGAGKSTLLKVLSRITEPTTGKVRLRGRVASLLEVGTGFHPELTGRENIFLNGAILGMSRAEIRSKFDEIVAFAEIERFLDTPVKRYSSGMYVRLAFAVAAHLDPEILIVDEVLAVGDLEFQKRCLGRMEQAASSGRTVLFVSHNLAAIQRLCSRGIYLAAGRMALAGPTADVLDRYLTASRSLAQSLDAVHTRRSNAISVAAVELLVEGHQRNGAPAGSTVTFVLRYTCPRPDCLGNGIEVGFIVYGNGQKLANFWSRAGAGQVLRVDMQGVIRCTIPQWPFRTMPMVVQVHINHKGENLVDIPEALAFDSLDSDRFGTGVIPHAGEGIVLLPHEWGAEPGPATLPRSSTP